MSDPFRILGISSSATMDDARVAYRKLAMKHHPDRGGSEETFKQVKEAWERIEGGYKAPTTPRNHEPQSSSFTRGTKPEPVWEGYAAQQARQNAYKRPQEPKHAAPPRTRTVQAYREPGPKRENLGEFIARVSIEQAFRGFICEVQVDGVKYQVNVPAGIPPDLKFKIQIAENKDIVVITKFFQSEFKVKSVSAAVLEATFVNSKPTHAYRVRDIEYTLNVPERSVACGDVIQLEDFLGGKFSVSIPAGHNLKIPIVVPKRGYVDWFTTFSHGGTERGDLIVRLNLEQDGVYRTQIV